MKRQIIVLESINDMVNISCKSDHNIHYAISVTDDV